MLEGLHWYTDTRKWRKENDMDTEILKEYDNIWIDRLMILTVVALIVGIVIGFRAKFLFI